MTLINDTPEELTLRLAHREAELFNRTEAFTLRAGKTEFLPTEGSVFLEFQVTTQEGLYTANTGYTEDYSAYSLRFFPRGDDLACELIHRRDGRRPIELTRLTETSPSQ